MEEVTIRRMEAHDLGRVLDIERRSYTMPWTEATFRGLLRRTDADLFVAETLELDVTAYAVFWAVLDQGELLDAVARRARERGVRELFLEVRVSNNTARQLYQSYGFREVGRRRNYYMEPVEDALVMRKDLEPDQPESTSLD